MLSRLGLLVVALGLGACASVTDVPSDSATTQAESDDGWARTAIARRPGLDDVDYETVSLAIDRQGGRHLAFVGEDQRVHYRGPTGVEKTFDEVTAEAVKPRLALGPDGAPAIAFTSDPYSYAGSPIFLASRVAGSWHVDDVGLSGEVDAIAIDDSGTVHIASNEAAPAPAYWRATVSTRKPGAAFVHTEVPRPGASSAGLTSYNAFGLVVDRTGAESLLLATAPLELGTGVFPATSFARRAAGGMFRVEPIDVAGSTGALTRDANGTLHAIVSEKGFSGTHPQYLRRGANDAAWSAPETIDLLTSYYSAIAVDARGVVHVAYSTNNANALIYAKRTGTSWATDTVFDGHAQLPSLALDPSGKPVIGYRSGDSYWLAAR